MMVDTRLGVKATISKAKAKDLAFKAKAKAKDLNVSQVKYFTLCKYGKKYRILAGSQAER